MKPLRVLHVVGGMNRAGIETWLMHVTRGLDRREVAFDFLLHDPRETAYEPELRDLGCGILRVSESKHSLFYQAALARCFESGRWDIVHSHEHHTTGTILRAAARSGVPVRIAHSHNDTARADQRAGVPRRLFNHVNRRWLERHADAGFAASPAAAAALFGQRWQDDARWRVLFCGIDLSPFAARVEHAELRQRLGIPKGARVIGHVGRFEEQKNHTFLIEIARDLVARDPNSHFLLVGEGRLQPAVRARTDRAGLSRYFTFAGSRPDVPELMLGAMDAFLFPSLYEGLGIAAIEAQAAGLPCIVSSVVPREADVLPGAIARLELRRAPGEWAGAVIAALSQPRFDASLRLAALEASPFSIGRSAGALLDRYETLVQ
ncbi:MAG TPA: glycosyltransferase [Bryobacteraceae bacterium]|nr:glycosyltransferase [Bryobacteraceae bacterium]